MGGEGGQTRGEPLRTLNPIVSCKTAGRNSSSEPTETEPLARTGVPVANSALDPCPGGFGAAWVLAHRSASPRE